jgi:hypothetical protein
LELLNLGVSNGMRFLNCSASSAEPGTLLALTSWNFAHNLAILPLIFSQLNWHLSFYLIVSKGGILTELNGAASSKSEARVGFVESHLAQAPARPDNVFDKAKKRLLRLNSF